MAQALSFFIIFLVLALLIFSSWYIPKRLCLWLGVEKTTLGVSFFSVLVVVSFFFIFIIGSIEEPVLLFVAKCGMIFLGLIPYLFLYALIFEVICLVIKMPSKVAAYLVILLSFISVGLGVIQAQDYKIYHVSIGLEKLTKKIRFYHISDVHLGPFRKQQVLESIVDDIKELDPDFVLINGDLIDGTEALNMEWLSLLKEVTQPIFFISGDHDSYTDIGELEEILSVNGVSILSNQIFKYKGLQVVGLDYMNADEKALGFKTAETIKSMLKKMPLDSSAPILFVHHSPVGVKYMQQAGGSLLVSGHTHGGQFFPFSLIVKLWFKYLKGLYDYQGMKIYVSQGIGTFGPPIRIGTEGEATLFTLVPLEQA